MIIIISLNKRMVIQDKATTFSEMAKTGLGSILYFA